jgi:hypothetical protein
MGLWGLGTTFWRGQFESLLTDTATWQRVTTDPDTEAEAVEDMGEVACRFEAQLQPQEALVGGAVVARYRWLVFLPISVGIGRRDRLVKDGETFAVVDTNRSGTGPLLQTVTCVRQQ